MMRQVWLLLHLATLWNKKTTSLPKLYFFLKPLQLNLNFSTLHDEITITS